MALQFEMDNGSKLIIITVYLPHCSDASLNKYYVFHFFKIEMVVSEAGCPYAITCGDFKANVTKHGVTIHRFGHGLVTFVRDADLVICDCIHLHVDTYTYLSEVHVPSS